MVCDKENWFLMRMLANPTFRSYDWSKRLNETMAVFDDIRVHRLSTGVKTDLLKLIFRILTWRVVGWKGKQRNEHRTFSELDPELDFL